jgi:hypothetical protein
MKQSPAQADIVQPLSYDQFGREAIKYLPFVGGTDGWYKSNFISTDQAGYTTVLNPQYQFYQSAPKVSVDTSPYAKSVLESSSLNRVLEQGAPGAAYQPDATNSYASTDRTVKKDYLFNGSNEVLKWTFTAPTGTYPLGLVNAGTAAAPVYYAANQLTKTKTKDEQYNEVIEYTDKLGKTVLKRVQAVTGTPTINDTNYASTYYIYDDFGNLICVIPPQAVTVLATEYYHAAATDATKDGFLKRWAFRYSYDDRRRMTQKQVPGADPVYMVYDLRDRLIGTQDALQRSTATKYWSFTKYDELNRPILTGIRDTTASLTQAQMQSAVNTHFAKASARWSETYVGPATGNVHGYSNKAYPARTGRSYRG